MPYFEHEGICLWYGTGDVPALPDEVPADGDITITIGVKPTDPSNTIEVRYRINRGAIQTVPAKWYRNKAGGEAQYFKARLPGLRAGDTVGYTAICRCAGRQVPSPEQAKRLESTFRVVAQIPEPIEGQLPLPSGVDVSPIRPQTSAAGVRAIGEVDAQTARLINAAVDALPPREFTVKGRVLYEDGTPLSGLTVRAFDRDLRREEPLGEGPATTGEDGSYRITYTADQFARAEKRSADLVVRVYSPEGALLGESEIIFNARQGEIVDLVVAPQAELALSEYEQLVAELAPLLRDVTLQSLTDTDVAFLGKETKADPRRLRFLVEAARLSATTDLPTEAFYGFARQELPLNLDALLKRDPKELRRVLKTAIDANVVPARLAGSLDEILGRLQALRIARIFQGAVTREFFGQLVEQRSKHSLAGYRVRAVALIERTPLDLGYDLTGPDGRFSFTYPTRATPGEQDVPQQFSLQILDPAGNTIHQTDVEIRPGVADVVQIAVPVPAEETKSPNLAELADTVGLDLPDELVGALAERGIHTLADVRRSGGLARLMDLPVTEDQPALGRFLHKIRRIVFRRKDLPVAEDHPALTALQAHANLSVLSDDLRVNARLIEHGYTSVANVAATSRADFVGQMGESVGNFVAFQLYGAAEAQAQFTDNVIATFEVERANGWPGLLGIPTQDDESPRRCGCEDCQAAVSPLAYLADLLGYAIGHLWERGAVDLQALTARFYQPFGRLPAACDALDEQVRQVRLCVEVLWRYLGDNPPGPLVRISLNVAERGYRQAAYFRLLNEMGTSYEELSASRSATGDVREQLAERIGVAPNRLDAFFLDPTAVPDVITEVGLEGLFGLVSTDVARDPLAPPGQSRLEAWRLERLANLWQDQDWPDDLPPGGQPLIDPDIIGPDDFRTPQPKANAADPDRAFDLWLRRRQWVDARLATFLPPQGPQRAVRGEQAPDLAALFRLMYNPVDYGGVQITPWANTQPGDFPTLADDLAHGDSARVEAARQTLANDLALSVEGFARLLEIQEKDRLWEGHPAHEAVSAEEWQEVASILVQAMKQRFSASWRDEEGGAQIAFGPAEFWFSEREPEEGAWPPLRSPPLIDPERVARNDLPEPVAGQRAIQLWQQRRDELEQITRRLRTLRETQGLQSALGQALGDPNDPANPNALPHDLDDLLARLNDTDPAVADIARGQVETDLHMSVEAFIRLMEIWARDAAANAPSVPNPPSPPTESEWAEVYAILTTAEKVERRYGPWADGEQNPPAPATPLPYWYALKARLPRWRADNQTRAGWRDALQVRYRRPLIDPDVIGPADLTNPRLGQPAYNLWRARRDALDDDVQAPLRQARRGAANPLVGLDAICQQALHHPSQVLLDLDTRQQEGHDITSRLAQLGLTRREFARLLRVRQLVDSGGPILAAQWSDVEAVLTNSVKRRMTAAWRQVERQAGITLSPDLFVLVEEDPGVFTDPRPGSRKDLTARREWQEILASRIEQRQTVIDGIARMISHVEEATLPRLRDALILATDPPGAMGTDLEAKGKRLTDLLLIDTRVDGCQLTTRISQAISTIQGLLWSVRTGQLRDTYPDLQLRDDYFDERWRWIGSYATWRAAIFVHLYPENILAPALHRPMTPGFEAFLNQVRRQRRRLNPDNACEIAHIYRDYYLDVVSLEVEASCHAQTNLSSGTCQTRTQGGLRTLTYWFGRSPASGRCYWSHFDPTDTIGTSQSFWAPIPDLEKVQSLRGAVPFRARDGQEFILLFAVVRSEGTDELAMVRYRLSPPGWEGKLHELGWPDEETDDFVVVVNQQRTVGLGNAPLLVIQALSEDRSVLYERPINADGDNWDDDWTVLIALTPGSRLRAMVPVRSNETSPYYLFFQFDANQGLFYRIFGDDQYPQFHFFGEAMPRGSGTWLGAILWPTGDQVFALWKTGFGTETRAWRLLPPQVLPFRPVGDFLNPNEVSELMPVYAAAEFPSAADLHGFNKWLERVTGRDLRKIRISIASGMLSDVGNNYNLFEFLTLARASSYRNNLGDDTYRFRGMERLNVLENFMSGFEGYQAGGLTGYIALAEGEDLAVWQRADEILLGGRISSDPAVPVPVAHTNPRLNLVACLRLLFENRFTGQPQPLQLRDVLTQAPDTSTTLLTGLEPLAVDSGMPELQPGGVTLAFRQRPQGLAGGLVRGRFAVDPASNELVIDNLTRIAPKDNPMSVPRLNGAWPGPPTAALYSTHLNDPASNLVYLEEFFYLVPVQIAMELQRNGHYVAARDWFRTVYDYAEQGANRKIWYGLVHEESLANTFARSDDWLLDPLNPHAIARTRANTYTRFTLLSLIRCFLAYADAEFTSDTAESIERARILYLTALELLDDDHLRQTDACLDLIGTIDVRLSDPSWRPVVDAMIADISGAAGNLPELQVLVDQVQAALNTDEADEVRVANARDAVDAALAAQPAEPTFGDLAQDRTRRRATFQTTFLADDGVAAAVAGVGQAAARDKLHAVSLVSGIPADALQNGAGDRELAWLGASLDGDRQDGDAQTDQSRINRLFQTTRVGWVYDPGFAYQFCIPPNPIVAALKLRAALNLHKLRHCRNIAGLERQVEPYTAATDTTTGLASIGAGGQLVLPGAITLNPTPYRYEALIARARELVQLAAQIEASMLAAIEKRDAELYSQLRARQDIHLTRAGVQLQDLRVREAEGGVRLAELQQERAQFQVDHYEELISEGLSLLEELALVYQMAAVAHLHTAAAIRQAATFGLGGIGEVGSALAATSSLYQTFASNERRRQEWEFQRDLAQFDVRISSQQVQVAQDHVRVVGQERHIAQMQADHAEQTAEFLSNKFTNPELYDWMSDVLEGVYAFFLQQATATAKLAMAQLAFERQEIPPPFIQDDYWEAPGEGVLPETGQDAVDRRGLTGSARLLRDIHQLDQFAFETRQRKLELSRTISLAQLAPAEFERFRQTGVITFATPMEMFDRDFPGHYLRQVKRVRVSVVALIPPAQGIRATLTSSRLSRVVVGGDLFQTVRVQQGPDQIALTTAQNATGLLELEPQSELLRPFEGIGVDTTWEFRMPKASNPFDYRTLADVLFTIEYTALSNFDYREQVIRALPSRVSADRPFSFRHQFADQWYDLHNPDLTATPMTVRFETRREDFPPNVENLRIQHVVLYFGRADGEAFEIPVTHLHFTEQGTGGAIGGGATSVDGVISTRRGNAPSWTPMNGKSPVGRWELALPNTTEIRDRFKKEEIGDILLVITYSGRTPEWPKRKNPTT